MSEPLGNAGFDWYENDLCCCLINTHFVFVFEWLPYSSASSCQVDLEIGDVDKWLCFYQSPPEFSAVIQRGVGLVLQLPSSAYCRCDTQASRTIAKLKTILRLQSH